MLWTAFTSSATVSACRQDHSAGIDEDMHVSISQLVHMLDANEPILVPVPPKTFVLGLVPFRMITETDAEWVVAAVSGWDDTVDMSPFCLDRAQCTEYFGESSRVSCASFGRPS